MLIQNLRIIVSVMENDYKSNVAQAIKFMTSDQSGEIAFSPTVLI